MERAIRNEEVVGSDGRVAMDLVRLQEKDTMGAFVELLRDKGEECSGKQVNDVVWLEFVEC